MQLVATGYRRSAARAGWMGVSVLVVVLAVGCASAPSMPMSEHTPTPAGHSATVTLEPGDVFEVRVYREEGLSGMYRVGVDGSIRFPLVGSVLVSGRSPEQVADLLREALMGGYVRDPQVTVFVKEFRSKKVFVLGQVAKPGTFAYEDGMNLIQGITLAGGFTVLAARNRTIITRIDGSEEQRILVRVDEISQGTRPNVGLRPGDIIFVPESIL